MWLWLIIFGSFDRTFIQTILDKATKRIGDSEREGEVHICLIQQTCKGTQEHRNTGRQEISWEDRKKEGINLGIESY